MGKGQKFYAVWAPALSSAQSGVYMSWEEAVKHGAQGVHGVKQKSFKSREEANSYLASCGGGGVSPMAAAVPVGAPPARAAPAVVPAAARPKSCQPNPRAVGGSGSGSGSNSGSNRSTGTGRGGVAAGEVACFTDGACKGNAHVASNVCPAGWGVAVIEGLQAGTTTVGGELVAELYGPVVLDRSSKGYLGAEVGSNNTGELCGICEALLWLAEYETTVRPAVICYDSEYAANQVQGKWKTNMNIALVGKGKELLSRARARREVRFLHVKGHSNHVWNDTADALANRGAAGETCNQGRWGMPPPHLPPPHLLPPALPHPHSHPPPGGEEWAGGASSSRKRPAGEHPGPAPPQPQRSRSDAQGSDGVGTQQ